MNYSAYPYFARLMSKGPLPIELCDHILSFSDEVVPVKQSRDDVPLTGWFYYSIPFKRLSEIQNIDELDICKSCDTWKRKCKHTVKRNQKWLN